MLKFQDSVRKSPEIRLYFRTISLSDDNGGSTQTTVDREKVNATIDESMLLQAQFDKMRILGSMWEVLRKSKKWMVALSQEWMNRLELGVPCLVRKELIMEFRIKCREYFVLVIHQRYPPILTWKNIDWSSWNEEGITCLLARITNDCYIWHCVRTTVR